MGIDISSSVSSSSSDSSDTSSTSSGKSKLEAGESKFRFEPILMFKFVVYGGENGKFFEEKSLE